jgi:hypothetical protein
MQGRVKNTLIGMNQACGYPASCSCAIYTGSLGWRGPKCDVACVATPLDAQCTNFDPQSGNVQATNAGNDAPVCTAFSPLSADVFGHRTTCAVEGTSHVKIGDEDPQDSHTTGMVQFVGPPCPGQTCAVGIEHSLNLAPVTFGNFFDSATFSDLVGVGESASGHQAMLSSTGDGTFAPGSIHAAGQAFRSDDPDLNGFAAINHDALNVNVGWAQSAPTCGVTGTLLGTVNPEVKFCENAGPDAGKLCTVDSDCTDDPACSDGVCNCEAVDQADMSVTVNLAGNVVNQPPTADAGAGQNVECTQAAGTSIHLDGRGSTDPDSNITLYNWFAGGRTGQNVGTAATATTKQALGSKTYVLRVIDADGQADEDTTVVNVVDTTPPVLSCSVATPVLTVTASTNHNLVNVGLAATAVDQCEGALPVTVRVFGDEDDQQNTGDGIFSPDAKNIAVGSLRLRDERNGTGDGRVYLIVPQASDSSGNRGFNCCTVTVPSSSSAAALKSVQSQAAMAKAFCLANAGRPPAGYAVIGDGPVVGSKQ